MKEYVYLIIYILVFGLLAHYNNHKMKLISNNGSLIISNINNDSYDLDNHYGIWSLFLYFGLFFIQAFRYYVGTDYSYYFRLLVDSDFIIEHIKKLDEPIIYILSYIATSISHHPLSNIIMFSFIIVLLLYIGLKQYDENHIMMSLLLYALIGGLIFAFNGVQQALAITFIFAFSKKAKKHWIFKYAVVVFVAFLIHRSALMFFPILILSQYKISRNQIFLSTVCSFIIPLFYDSIYEFMDVVDKESGYMTNNINPLRIVVAFAPLLLLLFIDRNKFTSKYYFETNMVIFDAFLSLVTSGSAYLNRFTFFTKIYVILFIPKCLKQMDKKNRIISFIIIIFLYTIYALYEVYSSDSLYFKWIFEYL